MGVGAAVEVEPSGASLLPPLCGLAPPAGGPQIATGSGAAAARRGGEGISLWGVEGTPASPVWARIPVLPPPSLSDESASGTKLTREQII